MKQPDSEDAQIFPLPPPREITSPMLRKLLIALGRDIPTLNWLITKYPHLPDPRPQQLQRPDDDERSTVPNLGQLMSNMVNGPSAPKADISVGLYNLQTEAMRADKPRRQQLAQLDRIAKVDNSSSQHSQPAARPIAPMYASEPRCHTRGPGPTYGLQFGAQDNGRGVDLGTQWSMKNHQKQEHHAMMDGGDACHGSMAKKRNSGFFNVVRNDSDRPPYQTVDPRSLSTEHNGMHAANEDSFLRRNFASVANMDRARMMNPQFPAHPTPQMPFNRPQHFMLDPSTRISVVDGHAMVMMDQNRKREREVEPESDEELSALKRRK